MGIQPQKLKRARSSVTSNTMLDKKGGVIFLPGRRDEGRALTFLTHLLSAWSRGNSALVCGNEFGPNKSLQKMSRQQQV